MGTKKQAVMAAILLGVLLLVDTSFAARSTDVATYVTTDRQKISGQDISGAKQKAVEGALEMAVQNAFASLVSHQVFAGNLAYLHEQLLPQTATYVVTYQVMEGMEKNGNYLVGVESKINLEKLEKDLTDAGILNVTTDKPLVLLLIAEQTPRDILPRYWWGNNPEPYSALSETIILERMADNRFKITGMGPDRPLPSSHNIQFSSIYDATAAMDLGRALNADMVILGKANASESVNRMGTDKVYEAVIDLKGYDLKSGKEVVTSVSQAAAKNALDQEVAVEAITEAAGLAAQDLIQKLDTFWNQSLRQENVFDVFIEGENFLPRFLALKKQIKEIRDIENMQPKEIGSFNAVMEVVFKGGSKQFADALMLKTFDGFGIEIVEITDQTVSIRFIEQ